MPVDEDALQQAALELLTLSNRVGASKAAPESPAFERLTRKRARARTLDEFRRRTRERRVLDQAVRRAQLVQPDHVDALAASEQRAWVLQVVEAHLSCRDRQVLAVLRDTDDRQEGAVRMGITPGSFTNAIKRMTRRAQAIVRQFGLTL